MNNIELLATIIRNEKRETVRAHAMRLLAEQLEYLARFVATVQ